ncbi:MAG: UDP-N-acetylmuramoyl-L-alanyl-D-glutamate--2,6-diaminopimelate ligase [Acetatifactor sp.]|nr:UDP-N-acetylmuramoyl-L-alanyl-D-glutamate--2,6-diaminopimelate ligase [Acetatifactor sp.]
MKLTELLSDLTYECVRGTLDREVADVGCDSRKVQPDSLFLCIIGANFDGHDYAEEVAGKGASVLVVSREVNLPEGMDVTVIRVEDTRCAEGVLAANWYGHPADRLTTIGITGTKGKTTTTYLVKSILENAGILCGLVGTIETMIGTKHIPSSNTTPDAFTLQKYFSQMVSAGLKAVVMEVSSQALMQHRTGGFVFDFGVFTNLEPDHIGPNEHKDFDEYLQCKGMLFRQCRVGIVNGDDSHAEKVLQGHTCQVETFGLGETCDLRASDLSLFNRGSVLGVRFAVHGLMETEVELPFPGRFSVYNALCAIAICRHFGVEQALMQKALLGAKVKGRIERVEISPKFTLLIDYAHNAMALESLLTTLREYAPKRLVCLFGCGGNRARSRRFEMGEVSGRLADLTIITSDNPRFEEPLDIIEDIKTGIGKTTGEYVVISDRREAIRYAISHAEEGDVIILAGKGHEDYQEIKGVKYPMDERVIIRELLEEGLTHI